METFEANAAFAALSQSTRLEAFRLLVQAGNDGLLAGELADRLAVKANTLSANLNVLLHAGLARNERQGRNIRYFADYGKLQGLLGFLLEECCGGKPELCQPVIRKVACAC